MRKTWVLVIAAVLSVGAATASTQLGWAVDNAGEIVNTSNGGGTWATQSSGWAPLYGVSFVDANNGWAVGGSGTIVHTSNGGVTWTPQTSGTIDDLSAVSFVDANNGWAVGGFGTIVHTSNGGVTWAAQTSNAGGQNLYGVSFVDPNNGWAVGGFGTIVHTSNGGVTWATQTSNDGGQNLYGVSFVDPNNGWAVGNFAGVGNNGTIVHTSNGGVSWAAQTSPTEPHFYNLYSVNFVDANNGWAVGGFNFAYIVHTSDGGVTWTTQTNPDVFFSFRGVSFVDANNGWAVGDGGTIVHTSDGGVTWTAQSSGTIYDLQSVSFPAQVPDALQIRYFTNFKAGDSYINLTNTGAIGGSDPAGDICVNVYVFGQDQQLISCCTCQSTPNHLQTLSANKDLVSNALTPGVPTGITTMLVASAGISGSCDAASPGTLVPGLRAWGTTLHAAPGGIFATTETPFLNVKWSAGEFAKMTSMCAFIEANGSGFGICNSCKSGAAGAARQ